MTINIHIDIENNKCKAKKIDILQVTKVVTRQLVSENILSGIISITIITITTIFILYSLLPYNIFNYKKKNMALYKHASMLIV